MTICLSSYFNSRQAVGQLDPYSLVAIPPVSRHRDIFLDSRSNDESQGREKETPKETLKCFAGVIIVLGVSAALQQTLIIVSGSPSHLILRKVIEMLCWGHNSPGG